MTSSTTLMTIGNGTATHKIDTLVAPLHLAEVAPLTRIQLFSDGANVAEMEAAYKFGAVQGFTTNPTLMRKAGVADYEAFARAALEVITDLPISFEVFADEFQEMGRQARKINGWGRNVNVKIPITNTKGESSLPLIQDLQADDIKLNVTALLTLKQVQDLADILCPNAWTIVSVFAGRIADTGRDPLPVMLEAVRILEPLPMAKVLWASPREVLNAYQAEAIGCHIITMTPDLIKKLPIKGKDLTRLSQETVQMFYDDAVRAGYKL